MKIDDDFLRFLKEYGVLGLALAVVVGAVVTDLVNSVVDGLIMPVVEAVLPGENWREAAYTVSGIEFQVGEVVGASIDFLIVALLVYLFIRHVLKMDTVEKV